MSYIIDLQKKKWRIFVCIILCIVFFFVGLEFFKNISYPIRYNHLVLKYSSLYDLDPYLILSMIKNESKFHPKAQSYKGAKGLMQITDMTGEWAAKEIGIEGYSSEKLYEPEINIHIGCWYIKKLLFQFGDVETSLAAYNAGSGNVSKWLANKEYCKDGKTLDDIPFTETKEYVKKVLQSKEIYMRLYHTIEK